MTFEEAITSILLYLSNHCRGIDFRHFYVGKTNDVETILFGQHCVSKEKGIYTMALLETPEIAKAVVQHFKALGMDGDIEDTENNAKIVYCYLVTTDTKENI